MRHRQNFHDVGLGMDPVEDPVGPAPGCELTGKLAPQRRPCPERVFGHEMDQFPHGRLNFGWKLLKLPQGRCGHVQPRHLLRLVGGRFLTCGTRGT